MNKRKIEVLVLTACYVPGYKGGGPIKTLKNLLNYDIKDLSFKLIASDRDFGDKIPYKRIRYDVWNTVGSAQVLYIPPRIKGFMKMARVLCQRRHDMIYLNSFFSILFSFLPMLIVRLSGQRIILAPRGEFSEGALSLKSHKKRLFIKLYKILRLHHGVIFQASSVYEANDIRRVLGTKVDIQIAENIGAQDFAEVIPTRSSDSLKAVFVSRISPMKNLLAALEMLQSVKHPVVYHIYGPVEDHEYWAKCKVAIDALPSHVQVEHKGVLNPEDVVKTISGYDVFFMPTKGENYGHVIAEALCAGLPILIADTTPWRDLQEQGIGWDLPLSSPETFSAAIDRLASMPADQHRQMREVVLAWAKNKFSQRDAVDANIAMFRYAYEKK